MVKNEIEEVKCQNIFQILYIYAYIYMYIYIYICIYIYIYSEIYNVYNSKLKIQLQQYLGEFFQKKQIIFNQ